MPASLHLGFIALLMPGTLPYRNSQVIIRLCVWNVAIFMASQPTPPSVPPSDSGNKGWIIRFLQCYTGLLKGNQWLLNVINCVLRSLTLHKALQSKMVRNQLKIVENSLSGICNHMEQWSPENAAKVHGLGRQENELGSKTPCLQAWRRNHNQPKASKMRDGFQPQLEASETSCKCLSLRSKKFEAGDQVKA